MLALIFHFFVVFKESSNFPLFGVKKMVVIFHSVGGA